MELNIKQKRQINKFGIYGFLKNLKLFEPFLLVYILTIESNFVLIGTLYTIREAMILLFEIPSGVLADKYGKKNQLYMCFSFYIASFILFFIASNYILLVLAFILYGLGEAFRSGTHKAMIMDYLDNEKIKTSKSRIYGLTRSLSMYGSMISSILGAIFVFIVPEIRYLFAFAVIPYVLDILLIRSYPSYMNNKESNTFSLKGFFNETISTVKNIVTNNKLRMTLLDSASFQGFFKTLKDYIQPIILLTSVGLVQFGGLTNDETSRVYLGVMYAIIFLFSAISTRNTYKLEQFASKEFITKSMWLLFSVSCFFIGIFASYPYIVFVLFILLYMSLNFRKPYMVQKISEQVSSTEKASTISIESQFSSIIIMALAPLLGWMIELLGIKEMFIITGLILTVLSILSIIFSKNNIDNLTKTT